MNARTLRAEAGQISCQPQENAQAGAAFDAAPDCARTRGRSVDVGRLLPLAPMFLNAREAAEYLGVSVVTFLWEVEQRIWPAGIHRGERGRRLTWFRPDLDTSASRLAQTAAPMANPDPSSTSTASLSPEDEKIVERIRRAKTKDQHQHRYPPKA